MPLSLVCLYVTAIAGGASIASLLKYARSNCEKGQNTKRPLVEPVRRALSGSAPFSHLPPANFDFLRVAEVLRGRGSEQHNKTHKDGK